MAGAQLAHIPARQQHRISEWYLFPTFFLNRDLIMSSSLSLLATESTADWWWKWSRSVCVQIFANPWTVAYQAFSVHGIFQARVLEWVAICFSRGSLRPRDGTQVSRIVGRCFTIWATRALRTDNCWLHSYIRPDFTIPWFQTVPCTWYTPGIAKLLETEERSLQDLPNFLRKKLVLEVWNDVVWMKRYDWRMSQTPWKMRL